MRKNILFNIVFGCARSRERHPWRSQCTPEVHCQIFIICHLSYWERNWSRELREHPVQDLQNQWTNSIYYRASSMWQYRKLKHFWADVQTTPLKISERSSCYSAENWKHKTNCYKDMIREISQVCHAELRIVSCGAERQGNRFHGKAATTTQAKRPVGCWVMCTIKKADGSLNYVVWLQRL